MRNDTLTPEPLALSAILLEELNPQVLLVIEATSDSTPRQPFD
jgi:hypothetical protein